MRERVELYADWVFGWRSSILTTMTLAKIAVREAGQVADPRTIAVDIENRFWDHIRDRFMTMVVTPALEAEGLRNTPRITGSPSSAHSTGEPAHDLVIWLQRLDRDLAVDRVRWLRSHGWDTTADRAHAESLQTFGTPLLPPSDEWGPRASLPLADLPDEQVRLVLLQSLRPLVSRAVGIVVRLSVFEALAGAVVFQSPEITWLAGMALSSGSAVTMTALFDGTANWLHEWVGRPALIEDLRGVVDAAEQMAAEGLYMRMAADMAALDRPVVCPARLDEMTDSDFGMMTFMERVVKR